MKKESVNHPIHYQHPSGYECIDLIRNYVCDIAMSLKYLWRAGLKSEEGMTDAEKEIEDLQKSIWYINDYKKQIKGSYKISYYLGSSFYIRIDIEKIAAAYTHNIACAIMQLSRVGRIYDGQVIADGYEGARLGVAEECINARINELKKKNNESNN